jgi:hypothetical protein
MKRIAKKKKMKQRKVEVAASEIRIGQPTSRVYETVKRLADVERRGIGKQADIMLLKYIEQNKL